MKISPSIASAYLLNIESELQRIGDNYETLHIDIEDGNFIPNLTFGFKMLDQLQQYTHKPFSVHLMVKQPETYIHKLSKYRCEYIFIHVESTDYVKKCLQEIKKNGIKAGLAFNPATSIDSYQYLWAETDAILLMTSEPDYQMSCYDQNLNTKIEQARHQYHKELWCDGGIMKEQIAMLTKMGVDCCVVGRALFQASNPKEFLRGNDKTSDLSMGGESGVRI